jgi:predicted TIM-barrel fold metal-dependent hydrolase
MLNGTVDPELFSVDYPYASNEDGRALLDKLPLSPADLAKLAHGNADRLLKLNA